MPCQARGLREALEIDQVLDGRDAVNVVGVRGEAVVGQAHGEIVGDPVRILRVVDGANRPVVAAVDRDRSLVVVRIRHRAASIQIAQQSAWVEVCGHIARGIAVGK